MSDIGTELYESVLGALPEAAATVRTEDAVFYPCLCASVGLTRANSEMGLSLMPSVVYRMPIASVPESMMNIGKAVTLIDAQGVEHAFRITERRYTTGLASFTVEAVNG